MSIPLSVSSLFDLGGIIAVITGGGTGLGRTMARALAENGAAKVYIVGRRAEPLQETAASYPDLAQVAAQVRRETGHLNLLVCNAGCGGPGLKGVSARPSVAEFVAAAKASPMAEFTAVYDLNCSSVYYTVLEFLELLDAGNRAGNTSVKSQVIATASIAGFMRDPRWGFAYCSSKAALTSMMKCFATYCVPWSIRFNAIAAGLFPTEMSMPLLAPFKISKDKELSEDGAFSKAYIPLERAGSDGDIAGALIYLVSRAGSYVNGSIMLVDGGKLAVIPATY